jgi:hypothetical protein
MWQGAETRADLNAAEEARNALADNRHATGAFCENYFWHFGHQKVERPFWTKRRTTPPQRGVPQGSPSRS